MPQAVWIGELSFGLVNIPIKLYAATSPKRVQFHHYEAGTGRRIRYRREAEGPPAGSARSPAEGTESDVAPLPRGARWPGEGTESDVGQLPRDARSPVEGTESDVAPPAAAPERDEEDLPSISEERSGPEDWGRENEVPWEDIVKGYEVEPGHVVTVDPEELESIAPERSRVLEVEQFVDLQDIDPVYFEKSYYVVPQRGAVTERPYWLLYRAMEEAGKVAVGRFVMRTKEYLVAVRPGEHVLMLETLYYSDEVREPKEVWIPSIDEPSERELRLARELLESLAGKWESAQRRDEHRERLLELIHSKLDDAVAPTETHVETPTTPVSDLIEALQASVEAATRAREEESRRTG